MPDAWLHLHSVKYFLSTHSECGTLQREQSWENSRSSPWSTASHVSDSKGPSLGSEPELFVLFTGPGPPGWSRSVGSILAQIWVGSLLPFLQTPARMAACQEGFFHHLCNPALTSYHAGFPVVLCFLLFFFVVHVNRYPRHVCTWTLTSRQKCNALEKGSSDWFIAISLSI